MRGELERQVSASQRISADTQQFKQAAEAATATLQHERQNAQKLAEELATVRRELESLAAAAAKTAGDNTAAVRELGELRAVLQPLQAQIALNEAILVQERARAHELEQKVAAASALPSPPESPAGVPGLPEPLPPLQALVPVAARAQPVLTSKAQSAPASNQSASDTSLGATASHPELPRLMKRATELLRQGDIAAARSVLERAAETENVAALFALAETFDPVVLRSWKVFGTMGDVARARDLYTKALAGGIDEAGERLRGLQRP